MKRRLRWRRPPPPRRRKSRGALVSVLLGLGLALLCVGWLDRRLTPLLLTLARDQIANRVNTAVTERVEATLALEGVRYGDMVTVEKDDTGRVTALTANTAQMNALRTRLLSGVLEDLRQVSEDAIPIPLSNLTGWDLLSDLGPALKVGLLSAGRASGEFRNEFTAAGVNQTRHQIWLDVTVTLSVLLPSGTARQEVTTRVPVAETVIVGDVPQQYITIGTGGT